MPRCPRCGARVLEYRSINDMTICQECGAILKLQRSSRFGRYAQVSPLDEPQGVTLTEDKRSHTQAEIHQERRDIEAAKDTGQSGSADAVSMRPSFRGDESTWGHCNHCGEIIVLSNSKFCSYCGASLRHGLEDATPLGEEGKVKPKEHLETVADHGEKCMVCDLELTQDDNVVWCPHCGNPAHRTHLLEWIHVKNRCPVCEERLREQDFQ